VSALEQLRKQWHEQWIAQTETLDYRNWLEQQLQSVTAEKYRIEAELNLAAGFVAASRTECERKDEALEEIRQYAIHGCGTKQKDTRGKQFSAIIEIADKALKTCPVEYASRRTECESLRREDNRKHIKLEELSTSLGAANIRLVDLTAECEQLRKEKQELESLTQALYRALASSPHVGEPEKN